MVDSNPAGPGPASTAHAASPPAPLPLPIAELEAQITELAGHLNAANHRWLMLIAEFDRRAESWLAHGDQALSGGDRQQIIVHVDAETLASAANYDASNDDDRPDDDGTSREAMPGRCELEDGPALAVETARRLACDASIVRIVEDGLGRPLDVGRKTRSIPPAIRRALQSRDAGCRFPGCTLTRFLDGHHIRHWADGGATRLSNLVLLCRRHHRQVHEGRVEVQVLDDGALRFTGPDGRAFEAAPRTAGDSRDIVLAHRREGLAIDAGTAVTRCAGERMDYAMAVEDC